MANTNLQTTQGQVDPVNFMQALMSFLSPDSVQQQPQKQLQTSVNRIQPQQEQEQSIWSQLFGGIKDMASPEGGALLGQLAQAITSTSPHSWQSQLGGVGQQIGQAQVFAKQQNQQAEQSQEIFSNLINILGGGKGGGGINPSKGLSGLEAAALGPEGVQAVGQRETDARQDAIANIMGTYKLADMIKTGEINRIATMSDVETNRLRTQIMGMGTIGKALAAQEKKTNKWLDMKKDSKGRQAWYNPDTDRTVYGPKPPPSKPEERGLSAADVTVNRKEIINLFYPIIAKQAAKNNENLESIDEVLSFLSQDKGDIRALGWILSKLDPIYYPKANEFIKRLDEGVKANRTPGDISYELAQELAAMRPMEPPPPDNKGDVDVKQNWEW